jgi:hypothetical protein
MDVGKGWVGANIQAIPNTPLGLAIEAGYKATDDLALYGSLWNQPFVGNVGVNAGARYKRNLDLYAGSWIGTSGNYGAEAGFRWRF